MFYENLLVLLYVKFLLILKYISGGFIGMILLTGATGYIGSNLWIELLKESTPVIGIDNYSNSSVSSLEAISRVSGETPIFFKGDVRDANFLNKIFTEFPITIVIHLAALKDIQQSMIYKEEYFDVNVGGLKNLLGIMRNRGCRKIIFSSSAAIYGLNAISPIAETSDLIPSNYYGETKLEAEKLLAQEFMKSPAISSVSLRYFNIAGSHPSTLLSDVVIKTSNLLFSAIAKVLLGEKESLSIFGDDWLTKDGTCVRDYLHVSDLAVGHLGAMRLLNRGNGLFAINLGLGRGQSVNDVISACESVTGMQISKKVSARRKGDVGMSVADIHLATDLIDWAPTKTLQDMCIDSFSSLDTRRSQDSA